MIDLDFLIEKSGDSILESYLYSDGVLTLILITDELNEKFKLKIKTQWLSFNDFYLNQKEDDIYRTCRIDIQDLSKVLSVKSNIYIPSDNFGDMMKECKSHYNLAYGKKSSEFGQIFSLVGYDKLISCLVGYQDKISLEKL